MDQIPRVSVFGTFISITITFLYRFVFLLPMIEKNTTCLACGSSDSKPYVKTFTMMGPQNQLWQFNQCQNCSFVYLQDRVPPQDLDEYYTEHYLPYRGHQAWGKYAHLVEWDQAKIDKARAKTLQKYWKKPLCKVLDVGCGKPSFLAVLKDENSFDCVGIDFSDEGWKGESTYSKIHLEVVDPKDYISEDKIDVVTMWHYLEHDYDPTVTLKHLLKSVHSDSRLIIEVPNHDSYSRNKYGKYWAGYHTPRHTGLFTLDTMTTLLERSGWQVVDGYSYGTLDPYTLDWMSRMEQEEIDWTENMENRFKSFVLGKIIRPQYYLQRQKAMGFLTMIAKPK